MNAPAENLGAAGGPLGGALAALDCSGGDTIGVDADTSAMRCRGGGGTLSAVGMLREGCHQRTRNGGVAGAAYLEADGVMAIATTHCA